jgi:steroid delta-isomerase-like uncharacterized protein
MSAEHKALVRRWFQEVWCEGSTSTIDELLSDAVVIHGLGPQDLHGPAGFKNFFSAYRNAFPDVSIKVDDLVAEGDRVVARWSGSGTHLGDGLGLPATGKKVQFRGVTIVRVEQGKLAEGWNEFDQLGVFQQLGVVHLP